MAGEIQDLRETFEEYGIDYSQPGFYNDPNFIAQEQANPEFLKLYGFFVQFRDYDREYLDFVRRTLPRVAEVLHDELKRDGRLRACIDMSLGLTKVLERHSIWCAGVEGAFNADYPDSSIEAKHLWHIDDEAPPQNGRKTPGHVWVLCPPFNIVDLTIKYQPYDEGQEAYLPDFILQEDTRPFTATLRDLCSPGVRNAIVQHGLTQDEYFERTPFAAFTRLMPPLHFKFSNTTLRYIPYSFTASDGQGIEGIHNLRFSGKSLLTVYEERIAPIFA